MELPEALYYAAQSRQLDRLAIERGGIAGYELMQRAGAAAFSLLRARWPRARRVTVVCGPGNNGGDGYVIARLAAEAGLQPLVLALGDPTRLRGDALTARRAAMEHAGVTAEPFSTEALQGSEVIVDALFGTGLEREVADEWRSAIDAINATAEAAVLAIDIPSGLHADSGRVLGVAVQAHVTISFIGLKTGLFTARGRDYCGDIAFDNLGVSADLYDEVTPSARRISERSLTGLPLRRRRSTHKGDVGHVAVIGGAPGMAGAARLAGEAAARTGAGLVTLMTHPAHAASLGLGRPELLTHALAEDTSLSAALRRATVLAIGPGLGQERWARDVFVRALDCPQPKVVDADALNLLAAEPLKRDDWILTPHPGEAARLLGTSAAEVQAQRFDALQALLERYGGVCVLKGAGTVIGKAGAPDVWLCDAGNPGMASGGMGDILTGIVAALLAQRLDPFVAARVGVWLHATAADDAAQPDGEIGLLASDLLPFVRRRLNQLSAYAR
jgi:hydroxyethylthiazole kinase-like uncharacterized protein yjeF